jgi:hypothetical protein
MLFTKPLSKHRYTLQMFISYGYLPLRGKSETLQVLPKCRFAATVSLRDIFVHVVPWQVSASLPVTPDTECIRARERRSGCWTRCTAGSAEIKWLTGTGNFLISRQLLTSQKYCPTVCRLVHVWAAFGVGSVDDAPSHLGLDPKTVNLRVMMDH